ncbi:NifU family protein [Geminicoccus roseus]|uniref:NifU family protein n=1 Tax=Geminicoccus roseus TaxID=404900 RepID=UPI00040D2B8A|nr:NifU family protein [Geminicoccus roseus]
MFIQTEQTPNPATLKFLPGQTIIEGGQVEVLDADEAERVSPLARRVFGVDGVRSVFITKDFVAVTKQAAADWYLLKPAVLGAMVEHFMSGEDAVIQQASPEPAVEAEDDETVAKIKELLETRVRPAVANDGGDIVFHGFERGVVYLHMKGACAGCPSSVVTLKNGIENLLRYYVPDVVEVRAID